MEMFNNNLPLLQEYLLFTVYVMRANINIFKWGIMWMACFKSTKQVRLNNTL